MNSPFNGHRAILERVISIDSTPHAIFPLLCPVRENEWVDGWAGSPVYSQSGFAEEDGVFATTHEGEDDTIWYVTRRDSARHEIEFVFFVPRRQVVRLLVRVSPVASNRSVISVRYIRTGISEAGNELIDNADEHFDRMMTEWEITLNHYMKTGTLMKETHP